MGLRAPLTEETPCPLCQRQNYEVVSDRDRDGYPLPTTICRSCGRPTPRKLLRGVLGAVERRRLLLPMLRQGARVLDVGCGAAEFVFLLRSQGVDAAGIEPHDEFASFARQVLQVPVEATPLAQADFLSDSFDAIPCFT